MSFIINPYIFAVQIAWNILRSVYNSNNKTFSALTGIGNYNPSGIQWSGDGTKCFISSATQDTVAEFDASTAFDVTTLTDPSVNINVSAQDVSAQDVFFKPDGTKMYVVGNSNAAIYQYTLSTAWDLSTASYDSVSFNVSSEETGPLAIYIKSDGTKMYILGSNSDAVFEYDLSTAWDLSTASYSNNSYSVSADEGTSRGLFFKDDGTRFFITGSDNGNVIQYDLDTAWDITSAVDNDEDFNVASQDTNPNGLTFKSDGLRFWIVGGTNDAIYEYDLE